MPGIRLLFDLWTHPANNTHRLRSIFRAIAWQIRKRFSKQPKLIPYHGMQLHCPVDNHSASRAIYFSNLPDYWEMLFMQDYLRAGDCFVDAGANIGLYTLLARSQLGESGQVHCFEPNPVTAEQLQKTITHNELRNVKIHLCGLSDQSGSLEFELGDDTCTSHIQPKDSSHKSIWIDVVRLDEILQDTPVTMAKFDIEGFEPFAVRGASAMLHQSNPPVLLIEVGGLANNYGVSTDKFIAELASMGYTTAIYDCEQRKLVNVDQPWRVPTENVLAIADSKRLMVEQRLARS
ncbi:MAG: FkbM family methyltransferase [Gammaproteobacteria bacterium]|nr:FkbM family methyltransferase [Gammaproteobacteria bacterium]